MTIHEETTKRKKRENHQNTLIQAVREAKSINEAVIGVRESDAAFVAAELRRNELVHMIEDAELEAKYTREVARCWREKLGNLAAGRDNDHMRGLGV